MTIIAPGFCFHVCMITNNDNEAIYNLVRVKNGTVNDCDIYNDPILQIKHLQRRL